jgi:hypothetical protein
VAKIPATASYNDLYQRVPVTPNTSVSASVWVKGGGSVDLQIWGNSAWTRRLGGIRINATAGWTKVTTPAFNTGNRSRVWLSFDNAYSNAAGTMYLDEVFLGTAGGSNRVANPGFESGAVSWTSTAPAVFSIQRNP